MADLRVKLGKLRHKHDRLNQEWDELAQLWFRQLKSAEAYVELAGSSYLQKQYTESRKLLRIAKAHHRLSDRSEKASDRLLRKIERVNTRRIKTERKLHTKENY